MPTNKPACHREHLLRDFPFKVGCLLAVRVDAVCLLDVAGEVLLLMLPRVKELLRCRGEGNHHHGLPRAEVRVGDARVQVALRQAAVCPLQLSAPAPGTSHVGYYAARPVGCYRIVYPHMPAVFRYVYVLHNHNMRSQSIGVPHPMQSA